MLLNFYVRGSPAASQPTEDKDGQRASYAESLASLTFEDVKEKMSPFIDSARTTFKYLRGDTVPSTIPPAATAKEKSKDQERTEERSWWDLTGVFSGLRGRKSHDGNIHAAGIAWTEGEVHADLVRNDEGYFVFRYLLIDIPDSESRKPIRVFVERAPGVRENEPIMRFHSS
jgi:import inner membrane translocase subunit TIM21